MLVTLLASVALAAAADRAGLENPTARLGDLRAVGTAELRTSCSPEAQASFDRATALLHSFFYEEARRGFVEVEAKDPGCAMAHWGVAMTLWHPIWTPPTTEAAKSLTVSRSKPGPMGGILQGPGTRRQAPVSYFLSSSEPEKVPAQLLTV
jgi:hypothetical protein